MTRKKLLHIVSGGLIGIGIFLLLLPWITLSLSIHKSQIVKKEAASFFSSENMLQTQVKLNPEEIKNTGEIANQMDVQSSSQDDYQTGFYPETASEFHEQPKNGEVFGMLFIPSLGIEEAILEGTGPEELAVATGHLPESVFPGQIGTSIIAAHNVTVFRHIDQLKEGMEITVTTSRGMFTFSVTGQRIVNVNDPIANMAYPAIALETCYPLDALYLTDKRLFVEAALVKSVLKKVSLKKRVQILN